MGKFDKILSKVDKDASTRDAGVAKQKCPLGKKPAIFLAVAHGNTGDGVSSIKVDVSKPTTKTLTTGGDGEAKADPAKKGKHNFQVLLTDEQKKKYATPAPISMATATGKTSVVFFILEPLPTLLVEVKDEKGAAVNGVRVRAGLLPEMTTASGKADFAGVASGAYRVTLTIPKPLETKVEVSARGQVLATFEPGYTLGWDVDLVPGDAKSFQVKLATVRTVEFILAEAGTDKPIANATLYCKLPGGGKATVVTDQVGSARVTYGQDGKVEIERIEHRDPSSVLKVETR